MRKKDIKQPIKWTEKVLQVREIGKEPPLNKEGFWKKPEKPEVEVLNEE